MLKKMQTKKEGLLDFSDYNSKKYRILYYFMMTFLIIGIILTLFPILWLLITSLKTAKEIYLPANQYSFFPKHFNIGKYVTAFNQVQFGKNFLNSIIVVIGAAFCSVFFNGLFGYGLAILKPKGYKLILVLVLGCMLIPATTAMVPLFQNIKSGMGIIKNGFALFGFEMPGVLNFLPLWLIAGANPFYVLLFKTYFDSLPKSLIEAAEIDGASKMAIFFKIVLPLAKPIIMVVIIFTINATWSDFLLPYLTLGNDYYTVMVKIYLVQSNLSIFGVTTDQLLSLLMTSMIPPIILFLVFSNQITSSVMTSGLKE